MPAAASAQSADPAAQSAATCEAAADAAEQGFGLPVGLLRAIGIVESGRWQPALQRVSPWPYAIDAGGYDLFMDTPQAAVAKVAELRLEGVASIDVGCFQINLMYHPEAFATLEEAFDPRANAGYAARFLLSLYARGGSWEAAVAAYHSAVPELGEPYRARVYAAWEGGPPAGLALALPGGVARMPPARIVPAVWHGWTRQGDNGFVRVTALALLPGSLSAGGVQVFVPTPAAIALPAVVPPLGTASPRSASYARSPPPGSPHAPGLARVGAFRAVIAVRSGRHGLPTVVTPSGE